MKNVVAVALIGSNAIQREGLISILRTGGFQHVRSYNTVAELSQVRLPSNRLVIWLIDARNTASDLPQVIDKLRIEHPKSKVVLLGDASDHTTIMQAIDCSVDGFLLLDKIGRDAMIKSLELVVLGEKVFPATSVMQMCKGSSEFVRKDSEASTRLELLSSREAEVLQELMGGYPNKVIARHCGITEATVKVHVKAILRKIHAKNCIEAAVLARKGGVDFKPRLDYRKFPDKLKAVLSPSALQFREIRGTADNLSIQPEKLPSAPTANTTDLRHKR